MTEKAEKSIYMTDDMVHDAKYSKMSERRIMKNLIVLSVGFLFLFSAFMALANLQSTMNNAGNIGVFSQSAIYGCLIISSLFLPKLVIKRLGCKLTLFFSILTYTPYIAANFYPVLTTLLPTAILLGLGAGTMWCSASTYINELSFLHSKGDTTTAALSTSIFFGIFIMFFQTTQIWGNLVSFYVLKPSDSTVHSNVSSGSEHSERSRNVACGAEFCGGINKVLHPLDDSERYLLLGIFIGFSVIAAVIVLFFLDSLNDDNQEEESVLLKLAATFNQMKKVDEILLIAITVFSGLQQGFLFGDYSEAFVACAIGLQNVGLVFVCFGICNAVMSYFAGTLVKCIPRIALIVISFVNHTCIFIGLAFWTPTSEEKSSFFIVAGFWGVSDAIWQTQLITLYGVLFREDEEAAFASYRLLESLGYMIAFTCSSLLCALTKIYMLIAFVVIGMVGYLTVEVRIYQRMKQYLISNSVTS